MPLEEREKRSQLCHLVRSGGILHGSLVRMARTCGNPGCRCNRGEKHVSWYLTVTQKGKQRMIYLPQGWEPKIRGWIKRYQEIRRALEELSELHWQRIQRRKDGK